MNFPVSVILNLGLLLLLNPPVNSSRANLSTLVQAQVIFRHGARTIDKTYPLDPYKDESFWPPGYSQLTNMGKLQGYNLGLYLRDRYDGFVKETYDVKQVYVQSSDIARTIQTAYSLMAGFYLPNERKSGNGTEQDVINSTVEISLPWKSVPVHTIPVELDNVLRQKPDICPKYNRLLWEFTQESDMAKRIREENKDLFEYFSTHTGLNITSPLQFDQFYDALVIENYYNMTLPDWTKPVYGTEEVTNIALFYFQFITYTFEMKRLRVGPLLQQLTKNMNITSKDDGTDSGQNKMYFYSGHDHCISGILDTLGMYDKKRPPFTSALILEIHKEPSSKELYVEIHYRNATWGDAYKLEIPNCRDPCPLIEFLKLLDPYIPVDWSQECKLLTEKQSISAGWIVFTIVAFWVLLFVAFQCWIRAKICGRKTSIDGYDHLI